MHAESQQPKQVANRVHNCWDTLWVDAQVHTQRLQQFGLENSLFDTYKHIPYITRNMW